MRVHSSISTLGVLISVLTACGDNTNPLVSIGGTVTGLAGTGLVLRIDGEELPITGDGPFTFTTPLHYGDSYDVTVAAQPKSPTQTCTITNGRGTVDGDDAVANISVTCETGVFTVGGTVTGLVGSGLMIENNGTDALAIDADGAFTFPMPLASGKAFSVTVKQQPSSPTQTCTVSGGAGTIGAGPVTSITIDCATDRFTVGGMVSGLAGTVVLQNNGGDDITVTADGSFAFPTTVASGSTYGVTVASQPGVPSQTCTVSSGTGTVTDSDVTSVRVDCATNMFTINGTVTGLAGSGLVLQNNGGDDIAITADGTFTFATSIASGTTYAVTVLAQPASPTQVCTVTNATGTVGSANVSDVEVTCTTSTFTIGGTVTGLVGSGLVLRNNNGDDLSITGDGTFTFATPIASGATYQVTIAAQPSNPTQTCTVAGGSGTVGASNVASVAVNCTTNTYTISGTISGLAGSVVLQNNGGDNLTVTANGTFAFATPVPSGANYMVAVLTQPASPSQTCIVTNGSGPVTNANITSVTVTCTTNQFTVGGTVTGLVGTGLVLRNNAGDDLAISADGTFTFATTIASGATYNVTVATQPSGIFQTCAVSNGSGIVGNTNVSDVTVTCTTNTYSIGGTVTGLVGTGLVVRDNGGDSYAISANGTFSFPTQIESGGTYSVTVFTQPTSPWQTCTVMNGSGSVTNADVTTVSITCTTNTYSIGGTVTGLAGSGLVLRNNAGDDLSISGDGSFTFTTNLASGTTYDVTVATQPSGPTQTCSVSGGTGTVAGSNVTSVTVNCTTNRYTIGGSISGLAGTVVLQNNGGDDLTLTANGTFSFATTVASGSSYAVTVKTQPASPAQTCTVTSASGTVTSSDVTNVSVTCTTNRYTIGGTLTGLGVGNTIVLRDNGADDLTLTADGAFTFSTTIASGSMYAVTVVSNPTSPISQTCSVTNGSGTVGPADVTNVSVTCTPNQFSVGGTVSGMTGSGLVLRNNNGDDLIVNADGSFVFATPVASGSPYSVTVATQPSGGASIEVCTVANGTGAIGNANVTNVAVTCTPAIYTFTTAGAIGRFGPTQTQLDTAYAGTSLEGQVTSTAGIQHWTVPATGTYQIEVWGAEGGTGISGTNGGHGARMRGDFTLTVGQTLDILVGQRGKNGSGAGGGGGSFVASSSTALIVAGGGGGGATFAISDASITTSGKTGDGSAPGAGGTNCNGGSGAVSTGPGGGGGFCTNGTFGTYNGQPGFAFLNGGNGGYDQTLGDTVAGGFGGGAGAGAGGHSGGAGGYSGGGASGNGGSGTSGGGGSYNSGTNQSNSAGANFGPGQVVITRI